MITLPPHAEPHHIRTSINQILISHREGIRLRRILTNGQIDCRGLFDHPDRPKPLVIRWNCFDHFTPVLLVRFY